MPKLLDPVWKHFERDDSIKTNVKAKCKKCDVVMQGVVKRMHTHYIKCHEIKQFTNDSNSEIVRTSTPQKRPAGIAFDKIDESSVSSSSPFKRAKQVQIDTSIVKTTDTQLHEINLQLTRAIASTNSPFSIAEGKQWRKLFSMLRHGIVLANRKQVGGDLLNQVYEEQITVAM